jgi:HEAT repeat protein
MGFMVHRGAVPEEVLRAGLESDDPRARAAVAEVLAGHASDFNVSRLVRLLGDANERVRATAAAMLGKSGNRSPPVLAGLVNALDLPGEPARTRICAALSELTGRSAPYDPKADPAARGKTIAGWKQWLAEQPKK